MSPKFWKQTQNAADAWDPRIGADLVYSFAAVEPFMAAVTALLQDMRQVAVFITKGSLGYLSSMYFSTSLVLGEVGGPFPEIESRESRTESASLSFFFSDYVLTSLSIYLSMYLSI